MQFFFLGGGLNDVITVPDGADLSVWQRRVSPGQTLRLAANGHYTTAFTDIPSGVANSPVTIDGNGATITGQSVGVDLSGDSYITIKNLNLRDQTACCVQVQNSNHIEIQDCSFASNVSAAFLDVTKNRNSSELWFRRCVITQSLGVKTCDGFEFWNCDNSGCEDCTATGLHNGTDALDNGHGFEVYGESAAEICTNIQFVRCHSDDCRVGFSCENPISGAAHTVTCTDCTTGTHSQYDYFAETATTLTIMGYDGGTIGGSGTVIHD